MSDPGLFVVGALVTLLVAAALSLLIYAAILDGRRETAERRSAGQSPSPTNRGEGSQASAAAGGRSTRGAGGSAPRRPSGVGGPSRDPRRDPV
jgi:hypothetical protein